MSVTGKWRPIVVLALFVGALFAWSSEAGISAALAIFMSFFLLRDMSNKKQSHWEHRMEQLDRAYRNRKARHNAWVAGMTLEQRQNYEKIRADYELSLFP